MKLFPCRPGAGSAMTVVAIMTVMTIAGPAMAFFDRGFVDPAYNRTRLARAGEDAGPLAPDAPVQAGLEESFSVIWNDYEITATHGFGIEAIVMSKRAYEYGDMSSLVPMDLALAWGNVSDPEWLEHLRVSQEERLYVWSFPRGTVLDARTVIANSANMHIMPATVSLLEEVREIRAGDLVRISGFLANISGPDGFFWNTSLVRTDTGRGSCEIILLQDIEIVRDGE